MAQDKLFGNALYGYQKNQVDEYVKKMKDELAKKDKEIAALKSALTENQKAYDWLKAESGCGTAKNRQCFVESRRKGGRSDTKRTCAGGRRKKSLGRNAGKRKRTHSGYAIHRENLTRGSGIHAAAFRSLHFGNRRENEGCLNYRDRIKKNKIISSECFGVENMHPVNTRCRIFL
jgi:hypothetical protein